MTSNVNKAPRATIIMTVRERYSTTEQALKSIVQNTPQPHRFIFAGMQIPTWLKQRLSEQQDEWDLEIHFYEDRLWPQQIRFDLLQKIQLDTEYVVFIDNDVVVEPDWLENLVACADTTRAGVVGPLYLWSDGIQTPTVHMAGGVLTEGKDGDKITLNERHHLINADLNAVAHELSKHRPCDFVEYHCMLIRSDLVENGGILDPRIGCIHEHIDTALEAKKRGYSVYFEPTSRVIYLAFKEFMLADLPIFRWRWDSNIGEDNIALFCEKWNIVNDDRSFGGVRGFLSHHTSRYDPLLPPSKQLSDRHLPMTQDELKQTRSDLLDLAKARGYAPDALQKLADAYVLAAMLTNGGYRPCFRPFINHLVGTASVLLRYGFRLDIVIAGLLHAAYSHCRPHPNGPQSAVDRVRNMLVDGSPIERHVRGYSLRARRWNHLLAEGEVSTELTIFDAEIVAMVVANEIDMHFSGEFKYTKRNDAESLKLMPLIKYACELLGVNGMLECLQSAMSSHETSPNTLATKHLMSFRLNKNQITSMVSGLERYL